jgi:hypothetical protein
MKRRPARVFQKLIVRQKEHQLSYRDVSVIGISDLDII